MTNSDRSYVTLRELMQIAIRFEVESAQFYQRMQESSTDQEVREVLKYLEEQEREHERILRSYKMDRESRTILQFPPSLTLSMPELGTEDPGMKELIDVAVERERKSAEIYTHSAGLVSGELKDLLDGLATFERKHEERLLKLKYEIL